MELQVTPAFPTLIGRLRIPDADAMNRDLQALIIAEEAEYSSLGRSNIGGWHSRPDFLSRRDPAVSALTAWFLWALRRMIDASAGSKAFQGTLSVSAWATLCRAGAYHAPHSHPDSAWSGVYYVDPGAGSADQPLSGILEFLDPRAGGGRDGSRRSLRRALSGPAAGGTPRDFPELAISLGSPLYRPNTSYCNLV